MRVHQTPNVAEESTIDYTPTVKPLKENFPTYPIETIRDLLFKATEKYGDRPCMKSKRKGTYWATSFVEIREKTEQLATTLFELGLQKGDRVGIIGENRTEWAISYLAVTTSGFVGVPIDRDLREREIRHILSLAGVKVLLGSEEYLKPLKEDCSDLPELKFIISMEEDQNGADLAFPEALGGRCR